MFTFSFKKNLNFLFFINSLNIRFFEKKHSPLSQKLTYKFLGYNYISFLNFNVREISPSITAYFRSSKLKKLFFGSFFDLNFKSFEIFNFPASFFFDIFFTRRTSLSSLISKKTSLIFSNFRFSNFHSNSYNISINLNVFSEVTKLVPFSYYSNFYSATSAIFNTDLNFFSPTNVCPLSTFPKYLNFENFFENFFFNSFNLYNSFLNKKRFLSTSFSLLNAKRSSLFYSNFF